MRGLPNYWLVDARRSHVRFEILRRRGNVYAASAPPSEPQTSRVLRARFTLRRTRNRLGRFAYRLAIGAVPSRTSRRK